MVRAAGAAFSDTFFEAGQALAFTDGNPLAIGSTGEAHLRNTQGLSNMVRRPLRRLLHRPPLLAHIKPPGHTTGRIEYEFADQMLKAREELANRW